ncbi:hypothetical protein HanXRQr2_Chr03g0100221 [Helianthus annuus]|uniref:Uncharacterized protein n=1 Tax=Helianthus annuus TaxID=4232 RepID=A0A9K3NUC8_HELAN|nr:hypothetical protein HanXRQr2_Chr03g0100221 [Helianthus annuus]KAJ0942803.1 hypothetical protein HanPSC8_Chr03g0096481 [Helianthus annuus]
MICIMNIPFKKLNFRASTLGFLPLVQHWVSYETEPNPKQKDNKNRTIFKKPNLKYLVRFEPKTELYTPLTLSKQKNPLFVKFNCKILKPQRRMKRQKFSNNLSIFVGKDNSRTSLSSQSCIDGDCSSTPAKISSSQTYEKNLVDN